MISVVLSIIKYWILSREYVATYLIRYYRYTVTIYLGWLSLII